MKTTIQYPGRTIVYDADYFGVPNDWFTNLAVEVLSPRLVKIIMVASAQSHKGYFRMLLRAIEEQGYKVHISHPVDRTQKIISRLGYKPIPVEPNVWARRV